MIDFLNSVGIWTPEQATAFADVCRTTYEQVWLPLHVPAWGVWKDALQVAVSDTHQAAGSVVAFGFLTLRPVVLLLYMALQSVLRFVWKYVIVKGISQQGVQHLVAVGKALYRYQRSLTPEQMAMEVLVVASCLLIYRIRQYLQRQTYIQRSTAYVRSQVKRLGDSYRQCQKTVRKAYDRSVQKLATTSLLAAVMTPHLVLALSAATLKFLFPRLVTWLACETALLNALRGWYPLIATILFLHERKLHVREKTESPSSQRRIREKDFKTPQSKRQRPPKTPSYFSRTTPASEIIRRRLGLSPAPVSNKDALKERQSFWLDFWTVHAGFQACKQLLLMLPIVGSFLSRFLFWSKLIDQLELFFYLWIFAVPYLLPNLGNAPEGRPLVLLSPIVRKTARSVYRAMNFFTDAWWEAYPLRFSTAFFDLAVLSRILSRASADALCDLVRDGQSLLIPTGLLLMPSFISCYGLFFVQYCVPLQKYQGRRELSANSEPMLRYWVIHCMLAGTVTSLSSILWWIPFSTAFVFALFLFLTLRESLVERCFGILTDDLEAFGLLPASERHRPTRAVDRTWTAQAVQLLLDKVPKASVDDNDSFSPTESNESRLPRSPQCVETMKDVAEPDDAAINMASQDDASISLSGDEDVPEHDNPPKQSNNDKENTGNAVSPAEKKVRKSTRLRGVDAS